MRGQFSGTFLIDTIGYQCFQNHCFHLINVKFSFDEISEEVLILLLENLLQ